MDTIYLDNAATTRAWPEVTEAVGQAMGAGFGNPSSLHGAGLEAARAVRGAMETVELAVGNGPWNVVFTSGGSESDTLAVLGTTPKGRRDKVITTTLEHPAITESAKRVAAHGGRWVALSGGATAAVDPQDVAGKIDETAAICTVTHLCSETGTVQPVADIAKRVKEGSKKCLFHTDAVQAFAQLSNLDLSPEVDLVSISAHKIHGPQGVGALLVRSNVNLRPIISGGDQQGGMRPGTLNVPGILGFQKAVEILVARRAESTVRMGKLTDLAVSEIARVAHGVRPLGTSENRAPGMVVLLVEGVKSEVLLHAAEARGIIASAGSACHSTRRDPPVSVQEAGLRTNEGILRLSLSHDTTRIDIDRAIPRIVAAIASVRTGRAGA